MPEDLKTIKPDSNVLLSAQKGDTAAFERILSFYEKAIFNHLYRLVQDKEEAADLTQETFIKLFKNRQKIDPEANFRAYLYRIATNCAYDWFKKRDKLAENFIISSDDNNFETIEAQMEYYSIEEFDLLDLEKAIAQIKPEYQAVIDLYFRQGFDYAEMASILDIPINTVKTHLRRAKEALKSIIS